MMMATFVELVKSFYRKTNKKGVTVIYPAGDKCIDTFSESVWDIKHCIAANMWYKFRSALIIIPRFLTWSVVLGIGTPNRHRPAASEHLHPALRFQNYGEAVWSATFMLQQPFSNQRQDNIITQDGHSGTLKWLMMYTNHSSLRHIHCLLVLSSVTSSSLPLPLLYLKQIKISDFLWWKMTEVAEMYT